MEEKTTKKTTTRKKVVAPVEETAVVAEVAEAPVAKTTTRKKAEKNADKLVKITLIRSTIGALEKQKKTVEALGLKKIRSSVVKKDNACTRGMIFVVRHLVSVEEVK
ncbi:MAG: 50S ribosomal protein L30 [Clostridia bacterium]|nr:50S ribosomal protein L30 [Clostridia bacterium]